jgi:hypothetical protein
MMREARSEKSTGCNPMRLLPESDEVVREWGRPVS